MASQTSNWILSASMVALALCCGPPAGAEPKKTSPFQAALESLSVKSEGALVAVAIDYADVLSHEEIFRTSCPDGGACRSDPNGWYLDLAPEIHIAAGDNGAFQSFTGKLAGNFVYFRKENLNDIPGLDLGEPTFGPGAVQHVFPLALGAESTRYFDTTAIVAEAGYVPFDFAGFRFLDNDLKFGINPVFGVFIQGGYKFDTGGGRTKGGSTDQSAEGPNDGILRFKADFHADLRLASYAMAGNEGELRLLPWATGWYDIANDEFYHSVGAILRVTLPDKTSTSIDFKIANGSGAPNFNTGTQIGVGVGFQY